MTDLAQVRESPLGQRQFKGFTGGPEQAREQAFGKNVVWDRPSPQRQLFDPEKIPPQEAHHQTPHQFAQDPQTWWHGRVMSESPRSRLPGKPAGRDEGFHAGTQGAARQRVTYNIKRRGLKEGKVGRMFPLRITGPVKGPDQLQPDVMRHRELGAWGAHLGAGYMYKNVVEGAEGNISVGTPGRKGYLSTHKEMVTAAEKRGEKVNPTISWAARHFPEHTGEAIREPRRYGSQPPQGYQMGLHEQFQPIPTRTHDEPDPRRTEAFKQLYPERTHTHRISYTTESGRQKHAFAFSTDLPGSALMGKQWSPSS